MPNAGSPPFVLAVCSPLPDHRRTVVTIQYSEAIPAPMSLLTIVVWIDLDHGWAVVSVENPTTVIFQCTIRLRHNVLSPYISHYLCITGGVCSRAVCFFAGT